ncbi:MAG: HD domain-containing protein [Candidatus Polarisedimenticolaceae bacterium]|nr:HD domain-containing protein [Candidatus Polarisedimenticolaceae bacterium]
MKKPSIETITVKYLVNFLLVLAVILLIVTAFNFRALSKSSTENQAMAYAELVRAGLTAHMKAGVMDKRDYYMDEIKQLRQIKKLRVIRSDEVIKQFGAGRDDEQGADAFTKQVFESRQPLFDSQEWRFQPVIRAIIPYIASSKGSLNCLGCHKVAEGVVLGVVDIELDVTEDRNHSLYVLVGMIMLSLLFMVLIALNTMRTIHTHVRVPLETLIDHTREAYQKHIPVSLDQFKTEEFVNVANEINLFNADIIAHQDLLKDKNRELAALNSEIEHTLRETVYTMGVIEEQRSKETHNHTKRVTLYSQLLAEKMGLPKDDVDLVTAASPLHDIGKLGIPDEVLLKPGRFTDEEHQVMQNHTRIGFTMLNHSSRDLLKMAGLIALQHHEKWDGSGYPQGLEGEEIHIFGRIVALADVFDALYSERIYKEAWHIDKVVSWINEQRGMHFDPALVDIFLENIDAFVAINDSYPSDLST